MPGKATCVPQVQWANPCAAVHAPTRSRKPAIRAGLKYETACWKALLRAVAELPGETEVQHGHWFVYGGAQRAYCQPDLIILRPDFAVIVEVKYTYTPKAWDQLELYTQVVQAAARIPTCGFQMCRNLIPDLDSTIVGGLETAIKSSASRRTTLHWLGIGGL